MDKLNNLFKKSDDDEKKKAESSGKFQIIDKFKMNKLFHKPVDENAAIAEKVETVDLTYIQRYFSHLSARYLEMKFNMHTLYNIYNYERSVNYNWWDIMVDINGYVFSFPTLWRFPYLCYKHADSGFIWIYVMLMLLIGLPIYLMETTLGHYTKQSSLTCWSFALGFKGIGYSMFIISTIILYYYPVITAWALYYGYVSGSEPTPWFTCEEEFCRTRWKLYTVSNCTYPLKLYGRYCLHNNGLVAGYVDQAIAETELDPRTPTLATEYFTRIYLGLHEDLDLIRFGTARAGIVLPFFIVVMLLGYFVFLNKSMRQARIIIGIYIAVVHILIFWNSFKEGYIEGLKIFFSFDKAKYAFHPELWFDALTQVIFSLSIGTGHVITMASYNIPRMNLIRDAVVVVVITCLSSLLVGALSFMHLGIISAENNVNFLQITPKGLPFVFTIFPESLGYIFDISGFWCRIYFLALFLAGMNHLIILGQAHWTSTCDHFPFMRLRGTSMILILTVCLFLFGLFETTPGGLYLVTLLDSHSFNYSLTALIIIECASVAWIYKASRFIEHVEELSDELTTFGLPWNLCRSIWLKLWTICVPLLTFIILMAGLIVWERLEYNLYKFDIIFEIFGIFTNIIIVIVAVVPGAYLLSKSVREYDPYKMLLYPKENWGPPLEHLDCFLTYVDGNCIDPKSGNLITTDEWEYLQEKLYAELRRPPPPQEMARRRRSTQARLSIFLDGRKSRAN